MSRSHWQLYLTLFHFILIIRCRAQCPLGNIQKISLWKHLIKNSWKSYHGSMNILQKSYYSLIFWYHFQCRTVYLTPCMWHHRWQRSSDQWRYRWLSAQDCSNSSALAMELLQSCTKPLVWSNTSVSDRCLISVDPRVFTMLDMGNTA